MRMDHQIVDLGVPRSSRGGGTNEINRLLLPKDPAEHYRLRIGCTEDQAGRLLRARETNSAERVRSLLLAGLLCSPPTGSAADADRCVPAHRELAPFSPAPSRVDRASRRDGPYAAHTPRSEEGPMSKVISFTGEHLGRTTTIATRT